VAPPFEIVDIALKTQPYDRGEAGFVPDLLCLEDAKRITAGPEDYCSGRVLRAALRRYDPLPPDIHVRLRPELARPVASFPSYEVRWGATTLRYAGGGITISDAPDLDSITSRVWNGRLAGNLYREVVLPVLSAST